VLVTRFEDSLKPELQSLLAEVLLVLTGSEIPGLLSLLVVLLLFVAVMPVLLSILVALGALSKPPEFCTTG
jgi:hypothetical protein